MPPDEFTRLPKALLHDHLDGGLRVETILGLADATGYDALPATDAETLRKWFFQGRAGSLERYLTAFQHTVGVLQTAEALRRVAYEAVVDLASDGVVYAEIRFAPELHTQLGLDPPAVVDAVAAGLAEGEAETGTVARAILTAIRDHQRSEAIARLAVDYRDRGVVGFDLAGPEAGFPPDDHLTACMIARDGGVPLTLHAGEGDGPESVWRALERCGASRIGQGTRVIEDTEVEDGEIVSVGKIAAAVRDGGIPLEICISSNVHTGIYSGPEDHPVGALHRAGFVVTLNTDNRLMSGTTLSDEFALAADEHGFEIADFQAVTTAALEAGFAPQPLRERLLRDVVTPVYEELA